MSAKKQTRNTPSNKPRSNFNRLARRFMSGLLRSLFFINKQNRYSKAGFVLPTTVLLLLVLTLTVGAISFRTASRTQSAFLAREQHVIDNIAAPAIDRGKAKLEYLFRRDTRLPGTNTPASDVLATLMLNIDSIGAGSLGITALGTDPYTLPDEQRIDINDDGTLDNAWSFSFDLNGDGSVDPEEVIAYSVLMDDAVDPADVDGDPATSATATRADDIKLEDTGDAETLAKANNLVTRNGPLNTNNSISNCGGARAPSQGWQPVSEAALEKNFQITAFVSNGKDLGRANSALELQQVRLAQRGNTWGAWFKYDLELHPGSDFNWNGAIHTDGNLMINKRVRAHMISSHNSCLYSGRSSEVTLAEVDNDGGGVDISAADSQDFQGQLVSSSLSLGTMDVDGNPGFHIYTNQNSAPSTNNSLTNDTDSVEGDDYADLADIAIDPVALFTQNVSRHRRTGTWSRAANWATNAFRTGARIFNQNQAPPYLDDFFRADNRYGPRPNYESYNWITSTDDGTVNTTRSQPAYDKQLGEEILSTDPRADNLINTNDGLDGYWERKAILDGMRMVVGQRLELGNNLGWNFNAFREIRQNNPSETRLDYNFDSSSPATDPADLLAGDPLYPYQLLASQDIPGDQNSSQRVFNLSNKQVQRVTLRDNLAAVQGMVVYHYGINNGQYPLACIANTSHPGTMQTLRDSRTFNINGGAPDTDFFNGVGTNGWEFSFPTAFDTEAEFGAALATTQPLGRGLRNLAHFAGDPNGGSPSFTPVQDAQLGNVHPFPHQSMWGDFSVIRRIFDDYLDNSAWRSVANPPQLTSMSDRYNALSPADKSSLHSATCTLGLLAYEIDTTLAEYTTELSSGGTLQSEGVKISHLVDNSLGNGQIGGVVPSDGMSWTDPNPNTVNSICPAGTDGPNFQEDCDTAEYYAQFTTQEWLDAYATTGGTSAADVENVRNAINTIQFGNQIIRDRALGFLSGNPLALDSLTGGDNNVVWDPATGLTEVLSSGGTTGIFQTTCDPDIFNQVTNGGGGGSSNRSRLGLALMVCSAQNATPVRYPSLYYLFPMVNHDHNGAPETGETVGGTVISPAFVVDHSQPAAEEYIAQVGGYGVNNGYIYTVLEDVNSDSIENNGDNGYAEIAFVPRASDGSDWSLPTGAATLGAPVDPETMDIRVINGANDVNIALSLLDKVMYNGREEMAVRVLDVDLEKLTRNTTGGVGTDYWISNARESNNGIVYAVREDAVREDGITRPVSSVSGTATTWADCDTLNEVLGTTRCWMQPTRALANDGPVDPPLSQRADGSTVGISVKPVDFAPDPDRRPYGFRLNAAFSGNNGDLSDRMNRTYGLTFVTDNAAYIKGEFNPHTSNGTDSLEEFTETLSNPGGGNVNFGAQFYNNRSTSNLGVFATEAGDRWRVAEVLADSVSLLSDNFVDGAVEEGFIRNRDEVSDIFTNSAGNNSRTSFQNQQRPLRNDNDRVGDANEWMRIDGNFGDAADGTTPTADTTSLPIWIGRNGWSVTSSNSSSRLRVHQDAEQGNRGWFEQPNERMENPNIRPALINAATPERMNATIISGLVPSRDGQGSGGLHNFPRFQEDWESNPLYIQGAFLQLNFSTAATAPFDADAWEPGETPIGDQHIGYYRQPERLWGYDVGLQFAPAGPIAQRFVSVGRPRSEHYRELPIDDDYVTNLRCATIPGSPSSTRVFPQEECSP